MSAPMAPIAILVFLATSFALPLSLIARPAPNPTSRISVVGVVYCDTCSTNTFSRHSYFLPGADVHIQCIFNANSPKTREKIEFSVNRTTDRYGIYKLEVPEVDGVDCVEGFAIESVCQASLIRSSSPVCNVPGLKISTNEISVKSKQNNLSPSLFNPPPPPAFNLGDPRTWIPNIPSLAPPPPPAFNLRDPKTWIPYIPPSPPSSPQNQNP
ncbi:hypothetical protein D5086_000555 [Populus alba]|uniref:Uncharacterized protein n=1 Tax=Populus alba TaxID=43335 RepID=A0ACC4CXC6_POPAL